MKEEISFKNELRRYLEDSSRLTDRTLEDYSQYLGLDFGTMKGKKILDIGSGEKETFAKQARELGIEVVSVNPKLRNVAVLQKIKEETRRAQNKGISVAGRAQELPFKDDSFDYEVALYSVPMYIEKNEDEYDSFLAEIIRTLKPDGQAIIFPINEKFENKIKIHNALIKFGDRISYKYVPLERILNSCPGDERLIIRKHKPKVQFA